MLKFRPYQADEALLLEISEDLFPCGVDEVEFLELRVGMHATDAVVATLIWDWYFVAESLIGSA
jgi:hypothetical protein